MSEQISDWLTRHLSESTRVVKIDVYITIRLFQRTPVTNVHTKSFFFEVFRPEKVSTQKRPALRIEFEPKRITSTLSICKIKMRNVRSPFHYFCHPEKHPSHPGTHNTRGDVHLRLPHLKEGRRLRHLSHFPHLGHLNRWGHSSWGHLWEVLEGSSRTPPGGDGRCGGGRGQVVLICERETLSVNHSLSTCRPAFRKSTAEGRFQSLL